MIVMGKVAWFIPLELFTKMQEEGLKPNEVTFTSILSASHRPIVVHKVKDQVGD